MTMAEAAQSPITPITCVYFKSGIGNLIQSTPAIRALASMDPAGQVDVCLCSSWATRDGRVAAMRDILDALPEVSRTFLYPTKQKRATYKRWFVPMMCETSEAGRWVAANAGMSRWPAERWPENMRHEVDVNMSAVRRQFGYKGLTPAKRMPVAEDPDIGHLPRPLIGLCNGAFGARMWDKKHWPHFGKLARVLKSYYEGSVIGVGGNKELDGVSLDLDFTGTLPIRESARVIEQLDVLVTTDTACMHIADAIGTNTVALFGPTLASKNAPLNQRCRVIRSPVSCAPCQHMERFHLCQDYSCMYQITVAMVMESLRRVLK